jgi:hypothetical protein
MAQRYLLKEQTTTQRGIAREGVRTSVVARVDRRVVDDKIVSTATIPFIRSRFLTYVGRNFKPNTKLYAFFDEVEVSKYITPAANVQVTPISGKFDYESSAEQYVEENASLARRLDNKTPHSAFNKGDIVYVYERTGFPTNTLTNTPGSGILTYYGAGNVMYLTNIKGTLLATDKVEGSISGARATLGSAASLPPIGSNIITNANGDVAGTFYIVNSDFLNFRTGTREFVLTDDPNNNKILADTQGRVNYTATGTLQTRQVTIDAVRNAEVIREVVREEDVVTDTSERVIGDTGWFDPLAQTFIVDVKNGAFLTKVDIFFSAKDTALPVTLELRNTVNGYPGRRTLPFSKVILNPEDVITSTDATKATTFTFKSPVYVEENEEYCIVLLTDSINYRVWISQLGENQIGTDRKISSQPYAGVLFKSQNASTWTADQLQDLKFNLYRAEFSTSTPASFNLVNDTVPTVTLPINALKFRANSSVVTVLHPSHGLRHGSNVTLSGFDGAYNIPAGNVNAVHKVGNVLIDSYTITTGNRASATTTLVSSNIRASRDITFNLLQPIIEYRDYPGTFISFRANVTSGTISTTSKDSPVTITANENNYFNTPKAVKSTENEKDPSLGYSRKSLEISTIMSTTVDNLSPVIDLNRTSAVLVSNKIDNITDANVLFTHDVSNVLLSNSNISLSGNIISSNNSVVANILGTLHVGKSLQILSNAGVNANVIISRVSNDERGNANVEVYYTFATQPVSSNVVTLLQRDSFIDERAYLGGSSAAKYVTRSIRLEYPSKFLKILFAANVPKEGDIDVYYRTLNLGSFESLESTNYILATPVNPITYTENPEVFTDVEYDIENIPLFNALTVKIVFRSSNSSQVPSIKDLRIIACP